MGRLTSLGRRWLAVLATVAAGLVVLAVVAALALTRPSGGGEAIGTWTAPAPSPAPLPEPPLVLGAADAAGSVPTADGVRAALEPLLREAGLGDRVSAEVVDVTTGSSLYRHRADSPTVPASTIKLVTAAAALTTRGPAYRIPTTVVAGATPGELVLVGGGDPTLAIDETGAYDGAARLDLLAAQVLEAVGDTPITKVTVDSTAFTGPVHGPWDADIPGSGYVAPITALMTDGGRVDPKDRDTLAERWQEPELSAGRAFAELLGLESEVVERGKAPPASEGAGEGGAAELTPGAELGRVESPSILRLVEIMLLASDNVVAEALARQAALARGEPASFTGGAAALTATLTELGLPTTGVEVADGSGLSRDNQIPASLLTALLTTAADRPALAGLFTGLPVAGWSGTLAGRFRTPSTGAGVVRAKTGTLNGVHSIAGTVTTADGRLLAFAFLTEQVPLGEVEAREVLDRAATALSGCGCS